MTLSLASRRRAPAPPRLNLDAIHREDTRDAPKTPPGPLTPNRPLVISALPALPEPSKEPASTFTTSTRPETPPATPTQAPEPTRQPTPPSTPTSSKPPDLTFATLPTLLPPGTTLLTSTSNLTVPPPSPTNTVFVTVVPAPVTVTRDAAAPTLPNPVPSGQSDTLPQPSAGSSDRGVSFTTGAGVVVLGVLGGVGMYINLRRSGCSSTIPSL